MSTWAVPYQQEWGTPCTAPPEELKCASHFTSLLSGLCFHAALRCFYVLVLPTHPNTRVWEVLGSMGGDDVPTEAGNLLLWHTGWRLLHTDKLTHRGEQLQLGHWSDTKHVSLQQAKSELKRAKAEPKCTLSKAREKSPTGNPAHAAPCSAQFLVS